MATQLHIEERYRKPLSALGLTSFRNFMATRAGTLAGVHDDRNVVRLHVDLDGTTQELYLKRTLTHPLKGMLDEFVSGRWPKARPVNEYAMARTFEKEGIPAMKAVAYGYRQRYGLPCEAFVLVEAVPAHLSLYQAWQFGPDKPALLTDRHKCKIISEIAWLIRRLHDTGLRWPDLVAKHILLNLPPQNEPSPRWDLHLIDLERMYRNRSSKTRHQDLQTLLRSLPPNTVSRTHLLRFALAYGGVSNKSWAKARQAIKQHFAWATPLYQQWRGQRTTTNRERIRGRYIKFKGITLDDRYIDMFRQTGVTNFKGVFNWAPPGKQPTSAWNQRFSFEMATPSDKSIRLQLKRFDNPPWPQQLRRMLRCKPTHSLAWWQWRWARKLDDLDIPTAAPIAFGEKMRGLQERRSFALFRELDGPTLLTWLQDEKRMIPNGRERHLVVERCAEALARLHMAGIAFRDNPAKHIALVGLATPDPQPYIVSLQTLFRPRWASRNKQRSNIVQLAQTTCSATITRTDKYRFLSAYLQATSCVEDTRTCLRTLAMM